MNVLLALNERLDRTPDGKVWSASSFSYASVERYLAVFDRVTLVARVRDVDSVDGRCQRVDGPRMDLLSVPYFIGPTQYLANTRSINRALRSAIAPGQAAILRMPAWHLTGSMATLMHRRGYPYAVEVCGDVYDRLAPQADRRLLRPLFRCWLANRTKQVCRRAVAALYVTDHALQRRYPASATAYSVGCSDVALPDAAFVETARRFTATNQPWRLVFVGSLAQPYKAPDILIEAVARCIQAGEHIELSMVGAGGLRPSLERLAAQLGISEQVQMLGQLKAGETIRRELDCADLFVLPSRQEGLPRAMVEAMARGLPCIGSTVGGIPELLAADEMVPAGDPVVLAAKIRKVLRDPSSMSLMSARNLQRAKEFHSETLDERRQAFYVEVRERTHTGFAETRCTGGGEIHLSAPETESPHGSRPKAA